MVTRDATAGTLTGAKTPRVIGLEALRDYGIVFSFVGLFITLSFTSDFFFTRQNLVNIGTQWSPTLILAIGFTLVLIGGGFDLSGGSTFAAAGVVAALLAPKIGTAGAILAGIGFGLGIGVVNGILVTIGRINAFIATLATSIMISGLALHLTGGSLIVVQEPTSFTVLGRGDFMTVPYSVWTFLAFTFACGFLLSRTIFGRSLYAVGGSPEAARLVGIRVGLARAATFVISGTGAAIGGIILTSRVATGQATSGGLDIVFDAFTGIVIGGTSITGGAGAVWRTVLGVMMIAMIGNGFNLLNVDAVYQRLFQGAIILLAVGIDAWSRRST
jgi:ribose transport system permease protein